ncbi:hypothetical protein [Actinosynnema sp. NPDC023587]|uniref:hypothetical protein n=1 Tax=Actinosynnema sp. NPDC023587 TaxID=3154695 RepID=UPI003403413D
MIEWPPDDYTPQPTAPALGIATRVGGRPAQADAAHAVTTPLGTGAVVIDGIGTDPEVCAASRRAAEPAALVASAQGARAGLLWAAATYLDYDGAPNAVGAVVSVTEWGIEIAHVGDCAVATWSRAGGLRRWTADQTAAALIRHMLTNPDLDHAGHAALHTLAEGLDVMDDYVTGTLVTAVPATIASTLLRGPDAEVDLVLLTSDGVHKQIPPSRTAELVADYHDTPQVLADALVDAAVTAVPDSDNATAVVLRLPPRARHALLPR